METVKSGVALQDKGKGIDVSGQQDAIDGATGQIAGGGQSDRENYAGSVLS